MSACREKERKKEPGPEREQDKERETEREVERPFVALETSEMISGLNTIGPDTNKKLSCVLNESRAATIDCAKVPFQASPRWMKLMLSPVANTAVSGSE